MGRLLGHRRLRDTACAVALAACAGLAPTIAAAGDAVAGKAVFNQQCAICHSPKAGANGVGPSLFGVVGRTAGTARGYAYSPAMKAAGFAWSADRLRGYLPAPFRMVKGTKMTYAGLRNADQLDDLIAYLGSLH